METERVKISQLQVNEQNPRTCTDKQFDKLVRSVITFPKMLEVRPIVVGEGGVALGGNMRLRALQAIATMTDGEIMSNIEQSAKYKDRTQCERDALLRYWKKWQHDPMVSVVRTDNMTEDERRAMGRACREYVCKNYSVGIMADICEREYLRLSKIVTGKRHDFTLCGYYGFGNTGDEALEKCIISSIRERAPSADICVMTHTPKKTSRRFAVSAVQRMDLIAVARALENTDTFVFGGGNLLQDKTSFASLLYYSKMLSLAKEKGCRTVIFANGLGPLESARALKITARALSEADAVSMRETYSLELAVELCPGLSPILTFDPAIKTVPDAGAKRDGKYFVVSPKFFSETAAEELIGAVKTLSERHKMKAYILPMYEKEDMKICEKVACEMGGELLPCGMSSEEVSGLISGAEVLIGSRLHSLVLATVALCPAVAVSDDIIQWCLLEDED